MKVSHVIAFSVLWVVCVASPIIRIKTQNGQKKSYCCYGVVKPFDMSAKAKQGLRALHRLGFDLKKLREVVGLQQKSLEGRLKGAEKKAKDISNQVKGALKATMKILSDATDKAAKKLGEVEGLSNDLGQLGEDLGATKTRDAIKKIRDIIASKSENKNKSDDHKKAKKQHSSSDRKSGKIRPKDRIPGEHLASIARSFLNDEENHVVEKVNRARDMIQETSQNNKRGLNMARSFLKQVEDGLHEFQSTIIDAGLETE